MIVADQLSVMNAKQAFGSRKIKIASMQHVKMMDVRLVIFKGQKSVTSANKTSLNLKMALV